jgi:hypothetical protein
MSDYLYKRMADMDEKISKMAQLIGFYEGTIQVHLVDGNKDDLEMKLKVGQQMWDDIYKKEK